MRNILKLFAVFVLSFTVTNWAIAGFPPVRIGGLLQALKTKFTLLFPNNSVVMKGGVKAYVDTGNKSHLYDGDFEGDSVATEWSVTNATATLVDTERVNGKQHLNLAVAAAIPSISQDQTVTVGGSFVASCWIKTDQIDVQFCSRIDGADSVCQNVSSSNKWFKYSHQNFTSDTSTSFGVSVKGLSSITGNIKVDNCELEFGDQTQNVAQSEIVAQFDFPKTANCEWTRTSTILGSFNVDTDCPAPTLSYSGGLGEPQLTDFDLPKVQVNNLPVGVYKVTHIGSFFTTNANAPTISITDGVTTCEPTGSNSDLDNITSSTTQCIFEITQAGNKTFEVVGSVSANTIRYRNSFEGSRFIIEYIPPQSQIVRQATENFAKSLGTLTFPANPGCDWTLPKTSTTYVDFPVDSDCNLPTSSTGAVIKASTSKQPEFILPAGSPKGLYKIRVNGIFHNDHNTNNKACWYRFSDGTINSTANSEYASTSDTFDGSKTFEFILDEPTTAETTLTMQSATVGTSGLGVCILRNAYSGTQNTVITVEYVPTDQKMTITGSFEQIKTTELCRARYYGNDGEAISVSSEDVPFKTLDTTVGDNCGIFTNDGNTGQNTKDAIVPIRSGFYKIFASIDTTTANNVDFNLWKDGIQHRAMGYKAQAGVGSFYVPLGGIYWLEEGSVYTIRMSVGMTLDNTAATIRHFINIAEIGDIASIVKNLNDNKNVKFHTKISTANVISGDIADLQFNNLVVGKYYRLSGQVQATTRSGNDCVVFFRSGSGATGTIYGKYLIRDQATPASINTSGVNFIFQADSTSMYSYASCISPDSIFGNGGRDATFLTLETLPDYYIPTSEN